MTTDDKTIIFVCEHGAAKSVIAAAYFNRFAEQRGLNLRAAARGTNPDEALSPNTVKGLAEDGIESSLPVPQKLLPHELENAKKVVSFCDLPVEEYSHAGEIERWEGVPPVSENYRAARDAILKNLERLLSELSKT